MDRLARNAMLARQAGMSYGKWKAMQPISPIVKVDVVPEGWRRCAYAPCNKPFKPYNGMQRYHDYYCRQMDYHETNCENQRKYREQRKERDKNGCV